MKFPWQALFRTNPGSLLSERETRWLTGAASAFAVRFPEPLFLNIGVYKGASLRCLRKGAPNASIVGIDVAYRDLQLLVPEVTLIWKDSRQVGPKWNKPIHLLFLDGGHSYGVVSADIRNFGKWVVVGGLMALHDYSHTAEYLKGRRKDFPKRAPLGVRRAADELCTEAVGWELLEPVDCMGIFRRVR